LKLGDHTLPVSSFGVRLEPQPKTQESLGTTRCGQPIPPDFDQSRWERDENEGTFHISGELFGGQARFDDLQLTFQRSKVWRGKTRLSNFNLAAALELFAPGSRSDFSGTLSGLVDVTAYPLEDPASAQLALDITEFSAGQAGLQARLASPK